MAKFPETVRVLSLVTEHGQVVDVEERRRPYESFGGRFMILFHGAVNQAVKEFRSGPTLRVLLALTAVLDWRAWRLVDQAELAGELDLHRSQVTTAMLILLEKGYVQRRGSRNRAEWRLCQKLGWRGDVKSFHAHAAGVKAEREPALYYGNSECPVRAYGNAGTARQTPAPRPSANWPPARHNPCSAPYASKSCASAAAAPPRPAPAPDWHASDAAQAG